MSSAPKQSSGFLARLQDGVRRKNDNKRRAALDARGSRIVDARGWRLPEGGRVESLGIDPNLAELVYASLPSGLKNKVSRDLLNHELAECQLAENGRKVIGGEHVLSLNGQSRTWNYEGRIRIGMFARPGLRVIDAKASLSQSRKVDSGLTDNYSRTSGPSITVGAATGLASHPNGSAGVGYKRETEQGHARNVGSEQASGLSFDSGYTYFSSHAELRIEVEWAKQHRALTGWVRGQSHKSIILHGEGLSGSSGDERIDSFKRIFSGVNLIYGVPTTLTNVFWPIHIGPNRAVLPSSEEIWC
ncbi:hypothetical protein [Streptomyces sp. MS2.AVA.5]|uniref:Uncharacterized protein n=3 Tax=Streptomyces achmelvichensis TaxID=3134111 RepID=A0ACC6Q8D5_9ACTN